MHHHQSGLARLHVPSLVLTLTSLFVLNGCEAIQGVFKAGVWVGIVIMAMLAFIAGGVALLRR